MPFIDLLINERLQYEIHVSPSLRNGVTDEDVGDILVTEE